MENEEIWADISAKNYKELEKKFPSVDVNKIIAGKVKYYREKPFQERNKSIWIPEIKEFLELVNESYKEETKIKEAFGIFDLKNQTEIFNQVQPFFYDKSSLWWLWNSDESYWEVVDEIDILNMIKNKTNQDIISSKNRTEILNSLKQLGREKIPKDIKKTWIQFKEIIYDIESGEKFKATSEYFVTNPIPWKISGDPNTPIIDKIFVEWVGEKNKEKLYQIIAYSLLPDYPIHRIFCFVGGGLNGKSKFLELLRKLIGKKNVTATELDYLTNSRFEMAKLYKKLVCIMGETNHKEISRTSTLKKLSGGDLIGFEYKNKNPFEANNYAKIIIATNSLPITLDKTMGWYRRWDITEFINEFTEEEDILKKIPDKEYENLATKCLIKLNTILETRKFHNEGSIQERMERYEEKSNPIMKFIKENYQKDSEGYILFREFKESLDIFLESNKYRTLSSPAISKQLRNEGFEVRLKTIEGVNGSFILGLKLGEELIKLT